MDCRSLMIGSACAATFATARALPEGARALPRASREADRPDGSKRLNALFDHFLQENLVTRTCAPYPARNTHPPCCASRHC